MSDIVDDIFQRIREATGSDKTVAYKEEHGGYIHEAMEALKVKCLDEMIWDFDLDEHTRTTALMIRELTPNR